MAKMMCLRTEGSIKPKDCFLGSSFDVSSRSSSLNLSTAFGKTYRKVVTVKSQSEADNDKGDFYFNITGFPFPLAPIIQRKTFSYEVEKDRIWLFEQPQGLGLSSVTTNVRMTVVKLKSGGLWVHAPIAPTEECIKLLKELNYPVEHIILPTFAYEHKIFVGPFSRKFPNAKVWTAPSQWSWPLNLPPQFFGIFPSGILVDGDTSTPWADEIEQKVVLCPQVGIGPYVEAAFFYKPSKTLIITDAAVSVPEDPLPVVPVSSLLSAARNGLAVQILSKGKEVKNEPVEDSPEARKKGWQRMVLQILFFGPSNLLDPEESFNQISGKLIVSPVIKTLVYNKVPEAIKIWVDSIVRDWKFKQIIPAHFSAPIKAGPSDFKRTFAFLDDLVDQEIFESPKEEGLFSFFKNPFAQVVSNNKGQISFNSEDMKTLSGLDDILVSLGAVKKTEVKRD